MITAVTEIRKPGIIYFYKHNTTMFPDGSEVKMNNNLEEAVAIFEEDKAKGLIVDYRIHYKY